MKPTTTKEELEKELEELTIKVDGLLYELDNDTVPDNEVDILTAQLHAMAAYQTILIIRVEKLN